MNLLSLQFGLFFLIVLALYYLFPITKRWWVLLAGSAAFYLLTATPYTAVYLVFSITSVNFATVCMARMSARHKKTIFVLALICNVGFLVLLKYVNGFCYTGSRLLSLVGVTLPPLVIERIAPLGMSFYTLQLISYLTDVYWGICPAEKNVAKLALFAAYFPSLSSGPILRYAHVKDELYEGHRASYQNITFGLQRMLWGLFKKMVIAERMAMIARPVFADIQTYDGVWLWIGLFAAVMQLYTDFSGNMDFVLGVSECFGVRLPENFKRPFFSLTTQEFWQRWHITLGAWLKDYIMYPLLRSKLWAKLGRFTKSHFGKKVAKILPTALAMFILWLVNGVWHSPYPKYFAVVMWFWFAVTAGQLLTPLGKKIVNLLKINTDCFSWRLFQRLRTFTVYAIGALFFCAPGIMTALRIGKRALFARNIFTLFDSSTFFSKQALALFGGKIGVVVLILSMVLLVGVEAFQNRGGRARNWLAKQNLVFRWAVLLGLIFSVLLFGVYGPGYDAAEFIYAGF